MASNQTDILISLNETDKESLSKSKQLKDLETRKANLEKVIQQKQTELSSVKQACDKAKALRISEQEKLDQEQVKTAERRKQISSMGGAKSAKLAEREIGITKRLIETLEQNVLNAIQNEENLVDKLNALSEEVSKFSEQLSSVENELKDRGSVLLSEVEQLKNTRESDLKKLDERTAQLYKRVENRYKGDAIAEALAGACKSCRRALPFQTFNQVIAGYNLLQCPGCSRILVYINTEESKENSESGAENTSA